MLKQDTARHRLVGIALVSVAVAAFAVLESSAKWIGAYLPIAQVVWVRFVVHVAIATALLAPGRGRGLLRTGHPRLQLLRGAMMVTMTGLTFLSLRWLQLAESAAVQFTVPILMAVLGAALLGERLDAARWAAIVAGFVGVLLIVRPGSAAFHPAMLLALANAVLYASFNLLTRRLAATDPPETTQYLSALIAAVLIAPFGIATWRTPEDALQWTVLVLLGVAGGLGHWLLAIALRYAPASVVAPFFYPQIVWMTLLGWWVFGEVPGPAVAAGATIVVASGLFLAMRERAALARPAAAARG